MAVEAPVKSIQVTDNSSEALHLTFTSNQHQLYNGKRNGAQMQMN